MIQYKNSIEEGDDHILKYKSYNIYTHRQKALFRMQKRFYMGVNDDIRFSEFDVIFALIISDSI